MTKVYLIRHSKVFSNIDDYKVDENNQITNEKKILSGMGEHKAYLFSKLDYFKDIDNIYSSHYVRAMQTAKYIAERNKIKLNIDYRLGERKFGVDIKDLPKNYEIDQWNDKDYKLGNGESINEVSSRMKEVLLEIINNNKNKNIVIVSHGTSILSLLNNFCEITKNEVYYNGRVIFNREEFIPLELFELEFGNDKLINIKNIKYELKGE